MVFAIRRASCENVGKASWVFRFNRGDLSGVWSLDEPIEEAASRKSLLVAWEGKYTVKIA